MTHDASRYAPRFTPRADGSPAVVTAVRGQGISCRVRPWPHQPTIAQVVLYQQTRLPSLSDLERWSAELREAGFARVRTTAVAAGATTRLEAAGFTSAQELVLLQHDDPSHAAPPQAPVRRLSVSQHAAAADLDLAAFDAEWSLDTAAIIDVCEATPRHRARVAGGTPFMAYAISGRDARQAFLQRLAVQPDAQRRGLGRALVLDSLRWAARWRADRVMVNTHVGNEAALGLYEGLGFRRLPERLHVYERLLA